MGRHRLATISIAYALLVASVAGPPLALGPGTAAANHDGPNYAVGQGGQCVAAIHPLGDGSQSGPDHYDYGDFASLGTTELQETHLSQFYVHEGSDGRNLVILHDEYGDGSGGGAVSFEVAGLPEAGEWTVEDDDYSGQDDEFVHDGTSSELHWMYGNNKTDGAVFRGLGEDGWTEITIDPAFKEESFGHEQGWNQSTEGPNEWRARGADGLSDELDMDEPVSIREGGCDAVSPAASLDGPDTATNGSDVTLDASNPDSPTSPIEYEWDFRGDGTVDATTTGPTVEHRYEQTGEVTATVTVTDRFGNTDTATKTIEIVDDAPTADADVPDSVEPGETFTADGSGSEDDSAIASYEWDFDDGSTATGETTTHAYDEPGEYAVTLTVTDDDGNADTNRTVVDVIDETPPEADLAVPESATAGSSVTLDASGSTDDGEIDRYEWNFGDGSEGVITGQDEPAVSHTYEAAGNYTAAVTVVDADGNADSANATIVVESASDGNESDGNDSAPEAEIAANETSVSVGGTVEFDGSESEDPDGDIVSHEWDFDDGNDGAGQTTEHAFEEVGEYEVTLTVTDDDGESDTAAVTITVAAEDRTGDENDGDGSGGGAGGGGAGGGGGGAGGGAGGGSGSAGGGGSGSGDSGGSGGGASTTEEPEPDLVVTSVSTDRTAVDVGESVDVTATVENRGDAAGTERFGPALERRPVELEEVTLEPGESRNLTFAVTLEEPGEQTISVGDRETAVTVDASPPATEVAALQLDERTIEVGEATTIVATVSNDGGAAGEHTVSLSVFGEVVDRKTVSVPPGETRTVRFTQRFAEAGDYTLSVEDRDATVEVRGEPDERTSTFAVAEAGGRTPGLGLVVGGGLALVIAALLVGSRV